VAALTLAACQTAADAVGKVDLIPDAQRTVSAGSASDGEAVRQALRDDVRHIVVNVTPPSSALPEEVARLVKSVQQFGGEVRVMHAGQRSLTAFATAWVAGKLKDVVVDTGEDMLVPARDYQGVVLHVSGSGEAARISRVDFHHRESGAWNSAKRASDPLQ
jgi:hypothetical protein